MIYHYVNIIILLEVMDIAKKLQFSNVFLGQKQENIVGATLRWKDKSFLLEVYWIPLISFDVLFWWYHNNEKEKYVRIFISQPRGGGVGSWRVWFPVSVSDSISIPKSAKIYTTFPNSVAKIGRFSCSALRIQVIMISFEINISHQQSLQTINDVLRIESSSTRRFKWKSRRLSFLLISRCGTYLSTEFTQEQRPFYIHTHTYIKTVSFNKRIDT